MTEERSRYPYRYETHLHTTEGSRCARMSGEEQIDFYADRGYTGVFVTNHFWGNSSCKVDQTQSFERQIEEFFSFADNARARGKERGVDVFCGIEYTYRGTDFLIYGIDPKDLAEHPEVPGLKPWEFLDLMRECGALVIQAHPFRLTEYSKIIRLMPRRVDGFEVKNGSNTPHQNKMAEIFGKKYGLRKFAGSDNHGKPLWQRTLCGVETTRRVCDERDFVQIIKGGKYRIFEDSVN